MKAIASSVIIAAVAAIIVVAGGAFYYMQAQPANDGTIIQPDGTMVKPDGTMVKPDGTMVKPDGTIIKPDGTMVKPDGTMIPPQDDTGGTQAGYSGAVLAGSSAPVIDFNKADYDNALQSDKLVVLYFYANWCPICRAEIPEMYAAFDQLSTGNVVAFRVNFNDDQTDADERGLAEQFGVPYQHTKVFLKNGQQVLKSPESWNKDRYLSEINKALA
ncbi:MAG: thioredoxin family protein [Candidatus Aenigmarchaeota archaeon]|nr:thioredoxin family protein [Candidatus Aenigmarchaeota archaeon]